MKDKILSFLRETIFEMKKVAWPDRRYVTAATTIVLIIVVIMALFLMFVDFGLAEFFKVILK